MDTKQHAEKTVLIFSTAYLPFVGGAELAVRNITDRIRDCAFVLITARMDRNLPRKERIGNVTVYRLGFGFLFDKWLLPFLGFFKARSLAGNQKSKIENYNLVLWGIMASQGSIAAYLFKKMYPRVPFLLTLQEGDPEQHLLSGRAGLMGFAVRRIMQSADRLQVISNYLKSFALRNGVTAAITVVPNGVDGKKFKIKDEKENNASENLKRKLGITGDEKVIITASRLVEKNAVDVIIRVLALLKKRGRKTKLLVIGTGKTMPALKDLARMLGVADDIVWAGLIDYNALPGYLVFADVFVRPSRSEGMGSAFVEAMAAGVPIIGTPVGGIPDFLHDGETGLFTRVDDPDDLAKRIEYLFADDALRGRLIRRAAALVKKQYQWDGIADCMQTLLRIPAPLRVLVATPLFPPEIGGPATYAKLLVDALPDRNVRVKVVTFAAANAERQPKTRNFIPVSLGLPKGVRHLVYFFNVLRHGRTADVIYAQDPLGVGLPSGIAAKILRKGFIIKIVGDRAWETAVQKFGVRDLLDDFVRSRNYNARIRFLRFCQYAAAGLADRIIVPSAYLARVVSAWGIAQDRITVIHNAYNPAKSAQTFPEPVLSKPTLISSGRLVRWKGFGTLVALLPELMTRWPALKLYIIGSGPEYKNLTSAIENLHLEEHAILAGTLAQDVLRGMLRAGDIFVLNTAYEGFSHQLLEAMDAGIPIVTTNVGGNGELIRDKENGLLVNYDDRAALRDAIIGLLADPALRERIAQNARQTVKKFSKTRMIEETLTVFRQTACRKPKDFAGKFIAQKVL